MLIDEAGQATAQMPVGALWRARRGVIVGDPLQLKPVVTLPHMGQQALRRTFGVAEEWEPSRTSAQRVADRLNRYGTWLPAPDAQGRSHPHPVVLRADVVAGLRRSLCQVVPATGWALCIRPRGRKPMSCCWSSARAERRQDRAPGRRPPRTC
ncbi:AAA domain-containing protein [Streptomyces sp. NBC_01012]|uniref:AAA domain-containing protein n=1 Tax=Streptomyces sp. NBC_01012 TaxID=2903717 RepID=UPI003865F7DB